MAYEIDDLIPREAARDLINTWGRQENESVRMQLLHSDLNAIPSVDAVPIVRCGECKYYVLPQSFCYVVQGMPKEDFYCAAGKRRDTD